jgi:hypothetical protein
MYLVPEGLVTGVLMSTSRPSGLAMTEDANALGRMP